MGEVVSEYLKDAADMAAEGAVLVAQLPGKVEDIMAADEAVDFDTTIFKTVLEGV